MRMEPLIRPSPGNRPDPITIPLMMLLCSLIIRFYSVEGISSIRMMPLITGWDALNSDGSIDTGFVPDGHSTVNAVLLQADGKIVIGADFL